MMAKPTFTRLRPSRLYWAAGLSLMAGLSALLPPSARAQELVPPGRASVADELGILATTPTATPTLPEAPPNANAPELSSGRTPRIEELPGLLGLPANLPLADRELRANSGPLNLHQAVNLGLAGSLEVQAAMARKESFNQTALAARGAMLPKIDARAAVGQGRLDSVDPQLRLERKEGNVTLRQALFDVPSTREYRRQRMLAVAASVQGQQAVSSATLEVASAFLQATQASLNTELSRSYEASLLELLEYVNARAKAGGTSNAERDRVRARVANARTGIADAKATLRTLLRNLESLIGEVPGPLSLQGMASLQIPVQVAQARQEAAAGNHDLRAARAEVLASALEAGSASARVLPRIDLELSHSRDVNGSGVPSYQRDNKVMVVVNWSLLNGGTDLAQRRAADARTSEKKFRADEALRRISQELETAYASLDSANERNGSLREELSANRSVVEAFRAQLVGGNRPLLDVLDALQRLHQSRLDLVQLSISEMQNQIKVAHLIGRLGAERADAALASNAGLVP